MMTPSTPPRKLSVFLNHAEEDKPKAYDLHQCLTSVPWIDPWLKDEKLLPGQEWEMEIVEAIHNAHVVVVCLSRKSVEKVGYVQKEIHHALDIAEKMPEHTIFIVPYLFDECDVPTRLKRYHYHWTGNSSDSYPKLLRSLEARAVQLGVKQPDGVKMGENTHEDFDFHRFIKISAMEVPYTFHVGKYPVTNAQYQRFLTAPDFADSQFWTGFSKFNEDCIQIGQWESEGLNWLQDRMKNSGMCPEPSYWNDDVFGIVNRNNPVVGVTWYEANAYCQWLMRHWSNLDEHRANPNLIPVQIRLPLEFEWSVAAGGETPQSRYPWDKPGKATKEDREIARRTNINGNIGHTTPVNTYLRGASIPYGVMDMAGNIWEWQSNFYNKDHMGLALRGGAWNYYQYGARVARRYTYFPDDKQLDGVGFRVICTVPGL